MELFKSIEKIEDVFELQKQVGSGLHAVVYQGLSKLDNSLYAVKVSKKGITRSKRNEIFQVFSKEVQILTRLKHVNIIHLYHAYQYSFYYAFSLDMMNGGELFTYINDKPCISEDETKIFCRQVLDGLHYMHNNNVAHFDIKPENIMLKDSNSTTIKIIDFSLACIIEKNVAVRQLGGTAEFMAPEAISYENISFETDMWSFGVLLYILLTGLSPYLGDTLDETQNNILKNLVEYDIVELNLCSKESVDLLKKLLVKTPSSRLSSKQALEHPWFAEKPPSKRIIKRSLSIVESKSFRSFMSRKKLEFGIRKTVTVDLDSGPSDLFNNTF